MSDHDPVLTWRTASFCGEDSCVEVAIGAGRVYVRNSRRRAQEPMVFDFNEWEAFVLGVRNHEFDAPPLSGGADA
ncbi:DUF397 domain-containing protein [Catenulispora sp. EB89]|uniref:DUF397 domain-containing protein n=1 Tax=Catenulispora sp. EB89 TaxID=3156257 RepID=UPI003516090E